MSFSGCRWCGNLHGGAYCPKVRAIEYHESGAVKRVEFFGAGEDAAPATIPFVRTALKVVPLPLPSLHDDNLPDPQFDVRCGSD
jgi:hypothetical protein